MVAFVCRGHQLVALLNIGHHGALLDNAKFLLYLDALLALAEVLNADSSKDSRLRLDLIAYIGR